MKLLKRLFAVIVALVLLFFIIAIFVDGNYQVEKQITIEKPKTEVFNYIKYLKNQNEYSVWQQMDPKMKKSYIGEDGTVGFVSSWESSNEKVGKGEQEIMAIEEGKRLDFELRFFEPFEATDNAYMITEEKSAKSTVVKWGFKGEMGYPIRIFLLFMDMDEMLGKDLQDGLSNLKKNLEQN